MFFLSLFQGTEISTIIKTMNVNQVQPVDHFLHLKTSVSCSFKNHQVKRIATNHATTAAIHSTNLPVYKLAKQTSLEQTN